MKNTKNKRVIILSSPSPYFEQCIFILKERVISEEEKLLNEAREVAESYSKRCMKSHSLLFTEPKSKNKSGIILGGILVFCSILLAIVSFL